MHSAISIRNLGKRYHVSHAQERAPYRTLRDSLARAAAAPLRRLRGENGGPAEEFWALKDVNFEIAPGEVVGIIGRNGAGKSTLLKILSRITKPTTGEVEINGRVGSLLEVGTGFHPELSGRENIYMNGSILGMSRREIKKRFDAIVDFAEVDRFLDTPVKRYSSGMYVRLAFSVAAHLEPDILIVDEVLAVGDAEYQKKCIGRMQAIREHGQTVIFVSHNMAMLTNLCTKAYLLSAGVILDRGSPEHVIKSMTSRQQATNGAVVSLRPEGHAAHRPTPIITAVRLQDESGEPATMFPAGAPMTILVDVEPTSPLLKPHLSITFDDSLGRRLFTVATYLSSSSLSPIDRPARIACEIESVPLAPGSYTLGLAVGVVREHLDAVPAAISADIIASDFYGNGRNPSADFGSLLVRSAWRRV